MSPAGDVKAALTEHLKERTASAGSAGLLS